MEFRWTTLPCLRSRRCDLAERGGAAVRARGARAGGACWASLLAVVVGLAVIGAGVVWWLHARQFVTTDDAFVDGYVTQMAPQVAGRVTALQFADNEHVTAGQVLVLIDPRDYQAKLDQAKAQRANAEAAAAAGRGADCACSRPISIRRGQM